MPILRPEDRKRLLAYVEKPRQPTKRMLAEALLDLEQGRSLQDISQHVGIPIVELRQLFDRFDRGGLEAVGLSKPQAVQKRPRRRARRATIVKTPEVCGGAARIDGTRIPVWQLVEERELGDSEAQLLLNYPTLKAEHLVAAWDYAEDHRDEIEAEIRENEVV